MPPPSEFFSLRIGAVTLRAFVTPEKLAQVEAGAVVDVLLQRVIAVHDDVGEEVALGDVACTFAGGEPTPFSPASTPAP